MTTNIRKITTNDCNVTLTAETEHESPNGQFDSGDAEHDAETIQAIENDLNRGNEWAWCCVRVVVEFNGLTSTQYLGGCSYSSEAEFKASGYFDDMVSEGVADIQAQLDTIDAVRTH